VTVDELIELTEGLLHSTGLDLKQLRDHGAPAMADDLTDEQFLLAVRFLAGERPTASERRRTGAEQYLDDRVRGPRRELRVLDDDEYAERLARLEELDEETPYMGPVDIGDGVTLGL
jgi:hypothetical protein